MNAEHARESLALTAQILRERMPPERRLLEFQRMNSKWPGMGWSAAVAETAAILAKKAGRMEREPGEDDQ